MNSQEEMLENFEKVLRVAKSSNEKHVHMCIWDDDIKTMENVAAYLRRPAQTQWRPIETAPKDRRILAIRAEYWTPVNGDYRWIFSRIRETNWLAGSECFDFGDEKQPTHWMPRPASPVTSTDGGGK